MSKSNDDIDIYDLLRQADAVLDEDDDDFSVPEEGFDPEFEESMNMDATIVYRNAANRYGQDIRNAANGYGTGAPQQPRQQPQEPVAPIRAYNADFRSERETAPRSARRAAPERQPQQQTYYAPARESEAAAKAEKKSRPKKRRHGCMTSLMVFAALIAAVVIGLNLFIKPPKTDAPIADRKSGTSAILLCGTDIGGERTDTMMLLFVDANKKEAGLLTLPRDTYTQTSYGLDVKLNSAYGRNGGGDEGMEVLLDYVQDLIGFRPDGYVLVDLPSLGDLIDLMGGVDFDVPQQITFTDTRIGLDVTLEPGMQHLDGDEALGLLRFRYGYYNQDLGRQDVQKQFLKACMEQWFKPSNLGKILDALDLFQQQSLSSLSTGNYLWFGWNLLRCGFSNISTDTLPGYATYIGDQSYYVLYPGEVADLIQDKYNPYKVTITQDDLNIVTE